MTLCERLAPHRSVSGHKRITVEMRESSQSAAAPTLHRPSAPRTRASYENSRKYSLGEPAHTRSGTHPPELQALVSPAGRGPAPGSIKRRQPRTAQENHRLPAALGRGTGTARRGPGASLPKSAPDQTIATLVFCSLHLLADAARHVSKRSCLPHSYSPLSLDSRRA